MSPLDGREPIADEEILYRKIPVSQGWYDPIIDSRPSPQAFKPHKVNDSTGLSLVRGGPYNTAAQVGTGKSTKGYYVAVLRAGDLRQRGIDVVSRPDPIVKGHVEIPGLNAGNRDSNEAFVLMTILANELCIRVEGPFPPDPPTP